MRTVLFLFSAMAAALSTSSVLAAEAGPVIGDTGTEVGEVVVTATRSEQRIDRIGQTITVLNRATIESSQATVVSDLVTQTPGVSFSRNGGVGGITSLRIRGAETDQTLLVVDGVKLNDPSQSGGGYNFANLLTGDIDRIEVLRGAQSTLWGSQAIGGVVQVITRRPTELLEGNVAAESGSMSSSSVRAGLGGATERFVWRLAGSRFTTDGVSAFAGGVEDDGYRNSGLNGRVEIKVADGASIDLRGVYSTARNEFDGFTGAGLADTGDYGRTKDLILYSGLNLDALGGRLKNRFAYSTTQTDRAQFNPAQAVTRVTFDAEGQNRRTEYQGVLQLRDGWNATFGYESERAKMRTASPTSARPNPTPLLGRSGINSVYGQIQAEVISGLVLTAGVRRDDHKAYGEHTLGQAALAWSLNGGATVLRASYGEGFKAPTLFQLYSNFGNLGLEPEVAQAWDAGVEQTLLDGRLRLSATYFHRQAEDLIEFFSAPSGSSYQNVARAKAQGVELAGTARVGALTLQGNYTWTESKNDASSSPNFGKFLPRRPEHQANLWATYEWPARLSTTLAVRYVGDAFDNVGNTYVLGEHTLVDLRASYDVSDAIELYGRVENVTDEVYETTRNYGSPGRAAYIGARAKF